MCYPKLSSNSAGFEPAIFWSVVRRVIHCATSPVSYTSNIYLFVCLNCFRIRYNCFKNEGTSIYSIPSRISVFASQPPLLLPYTLRLHYTKPAELWAECLLLAHCTNYSGWMKYPGCIQELVLVTSWFMILNKWVNTLHIYSLVCTGIISQDAYLLAGGRATAITLSLAAINFEPKHSLTPSWGGNELAEHIFCEIIGAMLSHTYLCLLELIF